MANIIKVYQESLPELRFIGKRYTNEDRDASGSYGEKWGQWFQEGWFSPLLALTEGAQTEPDYIGLMRCVDDHFEYWIGIFSSKEHEAPEGYGMVDLPAGTAGIAWIKGRDDTGEIYRLHNGCTAAIEEKGWTIAPNTWFFERYSHSRFTPDEEGEVILDYGMYLTE